MTILSVRIDPDIKQELNELAKTDDRTLSYLVNKILTQYCQKKKKPVNGKSGALIVKDGQEFEARDVVNHLNTRTGRNYIDSTKVLSRLNDKTNPVTRKDCIDVINHKCREWMGTKFEKYLRPSTLFNSKFYEYLAEARKNKETEDQLNSWISDDNDQRGFFNV